MIVRKNETYEMISEDGTNFLQASVKISTLQTKRKYVVTFEDLFIAPECPLEEFISAFVDHILYDNKEANVFYFEISSSINSLIESILISRGFKTVKTTLSMTEYRKEIKL